jgi:hypothetical protein
MVAQEPSLILSQKLRKGEFKRHSLLTRNFQNESFLRPSSLNCYRNISMISVLQYMAIINERWIDK